MPTAEAVAESRYQVLLEEALADVEASEPDDALEPTYIDEHIEQNMTVWYIAYSTS